jgi:hypothetical protein
LARVAKACKREKQGEGRGRDPRLVIDSHFFLGKYMSVPQNLKNVEVIGIFQRKKW